MCKSAENTKNVLASDILQTAHYTNQRTALARPLLVFARVWHEFYDKCNVCSMCVQYIAVMCEIWHAICDLRGLKKAEQKSTEGLA